LKQENPLYKIAVNMPIDSKHPFEDTELSRAQIEQLSGSVVLEFGTDWCGYCQAAQPFIIRAFADHPEIRHIKIEDGKGKRLGRLFAVKLWPTLIFLMNGKEIKRLVRPQSVEPIAEALEEII
jgi:thioredoxin 1